jgi:hypothetical protein
MRSATERSTSAADPIQASAVLDRDGAVLNGVAQEGRSGGVRSLHMYVGGSLRVGQFSLCFKHPIAEPWTMYGFPDASRATPGGLKFKY